MKTVITVGIGGRSFSIDEDAHKKLESYLNAFRAKTGMNLQTSEIMEEVEARIAELFTDAMSQSRKDVVDITMVNNVISTLGMPDGSDASQCSSNCENEGRSEYSSKGPKKFFRDPDDKKIGGVCGGLSAYLDVDVTLIRAIFLAALICGTIGFWIYIIIWIVSPQAMTSAQKCEMRGEKATIENMRKYM